MKRVSEIALVAALASSSRALATEAVVSVVAGGKRVALSRPEQTLVAEGMRRLVETCSLSSLENPQIVPDPNRTAQWTAIESQSHLYARFQEPLEFASIHGPPRLVSEALIGFENPYLIGPELTRHGETIVAYAKCDGRLSLELMCAAPLNSHLSMEQKSNCERLTLWLQETEVAVDDLDVQAVAAGQRILASSIDRSLSREPMESWLRQLLPEGAKLRWEANDCGEGGDAPDDRRDFPICAELRGEWGNDRVVSLLFAVGTEQKGISGSPGLFWAYLEDGGTIQDLTSLRDARERLRELSSR